ncbi:MAG: hypothetical protein RIQ46_909, partial [Pseudomonadota bacterium]
AARLGHERDVSRIDSIRANQGSPAR